MSKIVSKEDLKILIQFRQDYEKVIVNIGEITAKIFELDNQMARLETEKYNYLETYNKLLEKDRELSKIMTDKYGLGTINLETGEIA